METHRFDPKTSGKSLPCNSWGIQTMDQQLQHQEIRWNPKWRCVKIQYHCPIVHFNCMICRLQLWWLVWLNVRSFFRENSGPTDMKTWSTPCLVLQQPILGLPGSWQLKRPLERSIFAVPAMSLAGRLFDVHSIQSDHGFTQIWVGEFSVGPVHTSWENSACWYESWSQWFAVKDGTKTR